MSACILHRCVLAAVVGGGLACSPAWSQSADIIEKAVKDSIRTLDLQTDLKRAPEPFQVKLPSELIWAALICAGVLLLYVLLRDGLPFWRRSQDEWDGLAADAAASAAAGTQDALSSADALSRDGRFVEAMHLLLLQSLADIRQRLGVQFAEFAHQPRDPARHTPAAARPRIAARDRRRRGVDLFRRLSGGAHRLYGLPPQL